MIDFMKKAIKQYDFQIKDIKQIDNGGYVFLLNTLKKENFFLKIINEKTGWDYLRTENVFHSYEQLCIEMEILDALKNTAAKTAYPIKNNQGSFVSCLGDDINAVVTSYIDGVLMQEAKDDPCGMAYAAGQAAAYVHENSPDMLAMQRPHRNKDYIKRITDRIKQGVDIYKTISISEYEILETGAEYIISSMDKLDKSSGGRENIGLVHTDLRCGNFMYADGLAIPVDFTRSVYGYFFYDLGEMCAHMGGMAPDGKAQAEILRGYNAVRPLTSEDKKTVQVFFVMFLVILIAESIETNREDNQWFNNTVRKLCEIYIPSVQQNNFFINADF